MAEKEIIEAIPLRDQVADIIRRMIVNGELAGGTQISERQVSAMLNVSTTPVKEAFRSLQTEGLLYSVPRKGSFVSEHSRDNLLQYSYMRSALEGVAAYFAASSAVKEDFVYMEQELAISRELILSGGDRAEISRHNLNYHIRMRQASRNAFLENLVGMISAVDNSMRQVVNQAEAEELMERQEEHEAILRTVAEGRAEDAERLMVAHVRKGAKMTLYRKK